MFTKVVVWIECICFPTTTDPLNDIARMSIAPKTMHNDRDIIRMHRLRGNLRLRRTLMLTGISRAGKRRFFKLTGTPG
jgi:hypothetical protein